MWEIKFPEVYVLLMGEWKEGIVEVVGKEAVAQWCSVKKLFLEISQNLQESTCARNSLLIKLQT